MKKTPQDQIDRNVKWAKNNSNKVREYKRKYKQEQKELLKQYVKETKEHNGCKICGCININCLDFHHRIDSNKKDTICNLVRHAYSLSVVKEEIEKCDIICSNCHRTQHYTGRYMRNKKNIKIHNLKQRSKCLHCGCNKVECLDFHHSSDKTDGIGSMIRDKMISIEQLETEIKKCIILCSNCHRILHSNDKGKEH
jgi:hypothetical protein